MNLLWFYFAFCIRYIIAWKWLVIQTFDPSQCFIIASLGKLQSKYVANSKIFWVLFLFWQKQNCFVKKVKIVLLFLCLFLRKQQSSSSRSTFQPKPKQRKWTKLCIFQDKNLKIQNLHFKKKFHFEKRLPDQNCLQKEQSRSCPDAWRHHHC